VLVKDSHLWRYGLAVVFALALSFPPAAAAQQPDRPSDSERATIYKPSLAVVMELVQLSHFKLWLAGNLRNWPLAEYELAQMKATLQDARTLFPNETKANTTAISQSADEFRDAIRTKDGAKFDAAFKRFTSECNSCHEAVGLDFIKIKIPATSPIMTSPLSNQSFGPDQPPPGRR